MSFHGVGASTSDLRLALEQRIVGATYTAEKAVKVWLADELAALPFERMGDRALVDMAAHFLSEADIARLRHMFSAERYEVAERLFLCGQCQDRHLVEVEPGRWWRCMNCNPGKQIEPEETS